MLWICTGRERLSPTTLRARITANSCRCTAPPLHVHVGIVDSQETDLHREATSGGYSPADRRRPSRHLHLSALPSWRREPASQDAQAGRPGHLYKYLPGPRSAGRTQRRAHPTVHVSRCGGAGAATLQPASRARERGRSYLALAAT